MSKANDSVFVSHSLETSLRNVRSTASLISRILQQYNNGFKAEFKNTAVVEKESKLKLTGFADKINNADDKEGTITNQ